MQGLQSIRQGSVGYPCPKRRATEKTQDCQDNIINIEAQTKLDFETTCEQTARIS